MVPEPRFDSSAIADMLASPNLLSPPITKSPVDHVSTTFNGDARALLNKMYEYVKELHEDSFPDHPDHQE